MFNAIQLLCHIIQVKALSENSKPWWKWITTEQLHTLHEQRSRKPKRNSIEVIKDKALRGNEKRKPAIVEENRLESDAATHPDTHSENSHKNIGDSCIYQNEGFLEDKEICSISTGYAYVGYTLEIGSKVRRIPIAANGKDGMCVGIRRLSDNKSKSSKRQRKVSFLNN